MKTLVTLAFCLAATFCAYAAETQTDAFSPAEFRVVLEHAKSGDADAQMQVAACYSNGLGVKTNKTESLKWLERAAKQGRPQAQFMVGLAYYVGLDAKMDDKQGIEWFEKAANQGEPAALHYLSAAYYLGKGKQRDYQESLKWELVFMDSSRIMIPDDKASLNARIAEVEEKLTTKQVKTAKDQATALKERLSKLPRYSATD